MILVHHNGMTAIAILKLQKAGFTEEQVEALAEYYEAGTVTESDIAGLENRLDKTRADLELAIERVRSDLERRIDATRTELELKLSGRRFSPPRQRRRRPAIAGAQRRALVPSP